jgi:hypothetical protein
MEMENESEEVTEDRHSVESQGEGPGEASESEQLYVSPARPKCKTATSIMSKQ